MTREKFLKLPKWAQEHILDQEKRIENQFNVNRTLAGDLQSNVCVGAYGDPAATHCVPNHTRIGFTLPTGLVLVSLTAEGDAIEINGLNESLAVHPMASNRIEVDHDC